MKKISTLIIIVLLAMPLAKLQAQNNRGFETSVHLGIPTEEVEDAINLVFGIDFNYYFINVAEVLDFGFTGGYINFNGEQRLSSGSVNVALPDASFLRVGGSGRLNFNRSTYFALDLGYAIGLDDIEGGGYYQPKIGFNSGQFSFYVYYQKIYNDARFPNYSSVGVGATYHF